MKILVCLAKTPDTTAKITFTNNNTQFNTNGVTYIANPTDEWYALVRACEIKESLGGSVTVIHVGPSEGDTEQIIRKALAIGADDAVRVDAAPADAGFVAAQIAAYAKNNQFDIIFSGKETIDYNGFSVGGMVAELLDLPFISLVTKLEVNGNTATIDREIDGGSQTLEVKTPFVLSAQKGIAEQRIANMRGIIASRTKPLQVIPAVAAAVQTPVALYETPQGRTNVKLIPADNPAELVRLLHEEAKVI